MVGITNVETTKLNLTSQYYNGDTDIKGYFYTATGGKEISKYWKSIMEQLQLPDIVGIAVDLDNRKIYYKNETYINSGNPTAGTGGCIYYNIRFNLYSSNQVTHQHRFAVTLVMAILEQQRYIQKELTHQEMVNLSMMYQLVTRRSTKGLNE